MVFDITNPDESPETSNRPRPLSATCWIPGPMNRLVGFTAVTDMILNGLASKYAEFVVHLTQSRYEPAVAAKAFTFKVTLVAEVNVLTMFEASNTVVGAIEDGFEHDTARTYDSESV